MVILSDNQVKKALSNNLIRKKHSQVNYLPRPLDMGVIMGLLNYDKSNTPEIPEGWLRQNEIISQNPFFKSQSTNFPKYANKLQEAGIIEKKWYIKKDKYRQFKYAIYRLKRDYSIFKTVHFWTLIYSLNEPGYIDSFLESDYYKYLSANRNTLENETKINLNKLDATIKKKHLKFYANNIRNLLHLETTLTNLWDIDVKKLREKTIKTIKKEETLTT